MQHPLFVVPEGARARVSWALVGLTLALAAWLGAIDGVLRGPGSEGGIVGYELCGDVDACAAQLTAMHARGATEALAFSLGLDYLFLVAYSTAIAAVLVFAGARLGRPWAKLVGGIAWAQWGAALLDAIENFALWQMLQHGASDPWPSIATVCAVPKFAIVGLGLLAAVALLIARVAKRS